MDKHIDSKQAATLEFWITIGCIITSLIIACIDQLPLRSTLFGHIITTALYLTLFFYLQPVFEKDTPAASGPVFFILATVTAICLTAFIPPYFTILLGIKLLIVYFNRNKSIRENLLVYEAVLLCAAWLLAVTCCWLIAAGEVVNVYVFFVPLPLIMAYLCAVHFVLPLLWNRNKRLLRYLGAMVPLLLLSVLCVVIEILLFESRSYYFGANRFTGARNQEFAFTVCIAGNLLTQIIVIIPASWLIYKKRSRRLQAEIQTLKTELGKSDAHLNFLKSQINPHFLFNALNTLYGTALQENAERTGEGIQKLGDMMRLMLQENMQDSILLSRDLEYLRNYISLQELRTASSPAIHIQTQIEEAEQDLLIAPMLLIPFVENAFKHGISLISPSHIKITLQTNGQTLYFDIYNSTHVKQENDPEKEHSGIGLENVKQRLQLLYPGKHDLVIRENAKEFFVHLTLQLTSIL